MTNSIYDKFDKATKGITAAAILKDGKHYANITFNNTGARVYCYWHVIGVPMVCKFADGYGYNKHNAAFELATGFDTKGYSWESVLANQGLTVLNVV